MLSFANGDPWAWNAQLRTAADTLSAELKELFERGQVWAETEGIPVEPDAYAAYRRSLEEKPKQGERQKVFIASHMRRFAAHVNNLDVPEHDSSVIPMPSGIKKAKKPLEQSVPAEVAARNLPPRYVRQAGRL
jgi:hypothetical protein